ncbi:etoposide-induced protein 2.4-domain-containing protein [Infundibulicybe gibba]|nr:etoposide-induced protein 2.4-domain-containing protein [Infundibulicybe gibba]
MSGYPPPQSSRASYPVFIPLGQTIWLHSSWAWRGLRDSLRLDVVVSTIVNDAEIRANIYKSLLLNSLSLISIYTFDLLLQPLVKDQEKWFKRNMGWFYQVLWLLPVVGTSFYLNSTWCTTIAKRTFTLQHGTRATHQQPPVTYTGMLTAIATSAYRAVMVFTSVVVSFVLGSIPYIGPAASFIFMCWIDAYYCFEFVWAYYFAFGLSSAVLCTWGSSLANAAIFALVFPIFIILAMHAHPVPLDPYNPLPPIHSEGVTHHPSPFIPIRLPIFALVMWLNDAIVRLLSVGGGTQAASAKSTTSHGPSAPGRARAFSDTTESVEEGVG